MILKKPKDINHSINSNYIFGEEHVLSEFSDIITLNHSKFYKDKYFEIEYEDTGFIKKAIEGVDFIFYNEDIKSTLETNQRVYQGIKVISKKIKKIKVSYWVMGDIITSSDINELIVSSVNTLKDITSLQEKLINHDTHIQENKQLINLNLDKINSLLNDITNAINLINNNKLSIADNTNSLKDLNLNLNNFSFELSKTNFTVSNINNEILNIKSFIEDLRLQIWDLLTKDIALESKIDVVVKKIEYEFSIFLNMLLLKSENELNDYFDSLDDKYKQDDLFINLKDTLLNSIKNQHKEAITLIYVLDKLEIIYLQKNIDRLNYIKNLEDKIPENILKDKDYIKAKDELVYKITIEDILSKLETVESKKDFKSLEDSLPSDILSNPEYIKNRHIALKNIKVKEAISDLKLLTTTKQLYNYFENLSQEIKNSDEFINEYIKIIL